jgi:hypothetical protein
MRGSKYLLIAVDFTSAQNTYFWGISVTGHQAQTKNDSRRSTRAQKEYRRHLAEDADSDAEATREGWIGGALRGPDGASDRRIFADSTWEYADTAF